MSMPSMPMGLAATSCGFALIWFSIDSQQLFEGIFGGVLFGGGIMLGLFVK